MALLNEYRADAREQLRKAFEQYGIVEPDYREVDIRCDIRGKCVGQAGYKYVLGARKYYLRFNAEAIEKHNDEMVNDTTPHEIAHLVCYIKPELGKNHDSGWKQVCRELGGDDSRTHDMVLTPAKTHNRHEYRLIDGSIGTLGPKQHNRLQRGQARYKHNRTGLKFERSQYIGVKGKEAAHFVKPVAPKQPATSTSSTDQVGSKKQRAQTIYDNHYGNPLYTRAHTINAFMMVLNMTKAGASTYYYNCKKSAGH